MTDKLYFSTDFPALASFERKGMCLHLVCKAGSGTLTYNNKLYSIAVDDVVISPHPELITSVSVSSDLEVEYVMGETAFINAQLPAQHYGIRGGINLFDNPLLHASHSEAMLILRDFRLLRDKIADDSHPYYNEVLSAATLSMVYDLFACHARERGSLQASERETNLVGRLNALLESGTATLHREPRWYAGQLHVSSRYLSDTVKRVTGDTITYLISRYTLPVLTAYLKNDSLSFTQIADVMGFSSLSYFTRFTLRLTGMTPSGFRAKSK